MTTISSDVPPGRIGEVHDLLPLGRHRQLRDAMSSFPLESDGSSISRGSGTKNDVDLVVIPVFSRLLSPSSMSVAVLDATPRCTPLSMK